MSHTVTLETYHVGIPLVTFHYITLHKIVFRVPKITRTARTLCEIKEVMWEYSYEEKHLEKR